MTSQVATPDGEAGRPTVAVVGSGEMGSAVATVLRTAGVPVVTSLEDRSERTRALAHAAGTPDAGSLEEALSGAAAFLSIVPTDAAQTLAEAVAAILRTRRRDLLYIDCNAVSPRTVVAIGRVIERAGGTFVDGSLIGSAPGPGTRPVNLWLSGPEADAASRMVACSGIATLIAGAAIGEASAVKMCYAGITKGLAALATQCLVAGVRLGIAEHVEFSLRTHQPALLAIVTEMVAAAPPKARRWAAEMREIAGTCADSGVPEATYTGTSELYALVAATQAGRETPEGRTVRSLLLIAEQLAGEMARSQ